MLDQNEIERLLQGGGTGGAGDAPAKEETAPKPEAKPEAKADAGPLDQSELDALMGQANSAAPAAPAGPLNQSDLDALFGKPATPLPQAAAPAPPPPSGAAASTPAPAASGPLNQNDLDALFGKPSPAAAVPSPAAHAAPLPPSAPPVPPIAPSQLAGIFGGGMQGGGGGGGFVPPENDGPEEEDDGGIPKGDLDYILKRADEAIHSIADAKLDLPTEVIEFQFPEFGGTVPSTEYATLDQISEVELDIKIVLGQTDMYLEDVLKLRKGAVVPLDKMAGDPVDIYINGRLLARGEVLVMNENFCVRVAELLAGAIPME